MGHLDRKMRRDLWRMKGRAIASVLLITMGSMLYVSFMAMMPSVQTFFYDFYEESDFTDFEVIVDYAPLSTVQQLENISGVEAVEPRLVVPAILEHRDSTEISATLFGVNSSREMRVNKLTLTDGQYLNSSDPNGVLVEKNFAKSKNYKVGDQIELTIQQQTHTFTVRGLAVSPEFLFWAINPQAMIPLPGTLAVVFMPLETLQLTDPSYTGGVNRFSFLFEDGIDIVETQENIISVLAPTLLVLTKEDIPAYIYIKEDLEQGEGSTAAMALIFLLVAFFVVYSAYARLIAGQRREIGVLRGLGYSRKRVLTSYIYIAALMGLVGSILGVLISIPLGYYLSEWYVEMVFGLDLETVHFDIPSAFVGILFGPITAGLAAGVATISIIRLEAHEAIRGSTVDMKPVKKTLLERIFGAFRGKKLSYSTIYMSRNLSRRKIRSGLMVLAIGGSFVLGVMGPVMIDALVVSVDLALDDIEKWDLLVEFSGTASAGQVSGIDSPSIDLSEQVYRTGGTLTLGDEKTPASFVAIPIGSELHDFKLESGRDFSTQNEAIITSLVAGELGAKVGDSFILEIGQTNLTFEITGVAQDFLEGLFIPLSAVRNVGINESTALYVRTVDGAISDAEDYFKGLPFVSSVTRKTEVSQGMKDLLESFGAAMYVFSLIGILMTVLVVTNIVMISVMERYVEYGQMKAIGYKQRTIRGIVLSETTILAVVGVIIGIPLYWLIGEWFAGIMEQFFSFYQNVITWGPIIAMAIVTIIVALLAALPAVRHLGRMEVATVISERQFG